MMEHICTRKSLLSDTARLVPDQKMYFGFQFCWHSGVIASSNWLIFEAISHACWLKFPPVPIDLARLFIDFNSQRGTIWHDSP
jgi:hypothetical protein